MDSTNCLDDVRIEAVHNSMQNDFSLIQEYLHDSEKDDTVEENEELEDVVVSKQDVLSLLVTTICLLVLYCLQPSPNKVYRVRVTDSPPNRHIKPTHYFQNVQQEV